MVPHPKKNSVGNMKNQGNAKRETNCGENKKNLTILSAHTYVNASEIGIYASYIYEYVWMYVCYLCAMWKNNFIYMLLVRSLLIATNFSQSLVYYLSQLLPI